MYCPGVIFSGFVFYFLYFALLDVAYALTPGLPLMLLFLLLL
jgi:uncharacterized membrane protein YjgN (DUF898 family)